MNFFAIFTALLLEHARPLGDGSLVQANTRLWIRRVQHWLDAGQLPHAWVAWALAVGAPALLSALVYGVLSYFSLLLAFAWLVVVLYLTVGLRQFSARFMVVREALEAGDEVRAHAALAAWQQLDISEVQRPQLLRQTVEYAVLAATSGALHVRLGESGVVFDDGREPQLLHLASVMGLVWRSVVLWLMVMALMWLARVVH